MTPGLATPSELHQTAADIDAPDDSETSNMTLGLATASRLHQAAADVDAPDNPETSNMTPDDPEVSNMTPGLATPSELHQTSVFFQAAADIDAQDDLEASNMTLGLATTSEFHQAAADVDAPDNPETSNMTLGLAATSEFFQAAADVDAPDNPEASNMTWVILETASESHQAAADIDAPDNPEASNMTWVILETASESHQAVADVDAPDDPEASNMTYVVGFTVEDAADASDVFISDLDDSIADEDYVQPSDCSSDIDTDTESCSFVWPRHTQHDDFCHSVPDVSDDQSLQACAEVATPAVRQSGNIESHSPMLESINQESSTQHDSRKRKTNRIARPCPFCHSMQTNLQRHIKLKHKDVDVVKHALTLPQEEKLKVFSSFKKKGIYEYNRKQLKIRDDSCQSERSKANSSELLMCSVCNGFYAKSYVGRHRKTCSAESASAATSYPIKLLTCKNVTDKFKEVVLCHFYNDEVGSMCQSDDAIILFGSKMFDKSKGKHDKKNEVRKTVMADMRRLARLFVEFRHHFKGKEVPTSSLEMLQRCNFHQLEAAVETYTQSNENEKSLKAGLKVGLYYLLKRFAKVCKGMHLINDKDDKAAEVDKFVEVLELNYHSLFGDAMYALNRNRQVKLRRPAALPSEEDVSKLRQYNVARMQELLSNPYKMWDSHSYIELRDLAVCRLTVFNARRGGEPARLVISEWQDAENGSWLDPKRLQVAATDKELTMFRNLKVTYQGGKGNNHLVPVLIPDDVVLAMQTLCSESVREMADVHQQNQYMFPHTQMSATHVNGWQAVQRVCIDAKVEHPERLTATKMRHRISTLYAAMDVPTDEREFFYKHMGHSQKINENVYQAPLAELEIVKVGSRLMAMDGKVPNLASAHSDTSTSTATCEDEDVEPDSCSPRPLAEESEAVSPTVEQSMAENEVASKPLKGTVDLLIVYMQHVFAQMFLCKAVILTQSSSVSRYMVYLSDLTP